MSYSTVQVSVQRGTQQRERLTHTDKTHSTPYSTLQTRMERQIQNHTEHGTHSTPQFMTRTSRPVQNHADHRIHCMSYGEHSTSHFKTRTGQYTPNHAEHSTDSTTYSASRTRGHTQNLLYTPARYQDRK